MGNQERAVREREQPVAVDETVDAADGRILIVGPAGPHVERLVRWARPCSESIVRAPLDAVGSHGFPEIDIAVVVPDEPEERWTQRVAGIRSSRPECRIVSVLSDPPTAQRIPTVVDEVLVEPINRATFQNTIAAMSVRAAYHRSLSELYELAAAKAAVEEDQSGEGAGGRDALERDLDEAIAATREQVTSTFELLTTLDGYPKVFQSVPRDGGGEVEYETDSSPSPQHASSAPPSSDSDPAALE